MTTHFCVVPVVLGIVSVAVLPLRGEPPKETAASLVRAALLAEQQGRNDQREKLLKSALAASPDYAPARWHTGHVQVDGRWLTIIESQERARSDECLAQYVLKRASAAETAAAQLDLSRWCRKSGLDEQERFHLGRVLKLPDATAEQQNEAMRKLGVRRVDGRFLTEEENERREEHEQFVQRSLNQWRPHLERIELCLTGDDETARAEALAELQAIDEPEALPALEFCAARHSEAFGLEVVELLSRMEQQEAIDSLVRHAVCAPSPKVRDAAAEALSQRPLHSYVEPLVAGLQAPVESSVVAQPVAGTVRFRHVLSREGRQVKEELVEDVFVHPRTIVTEFIGSPVAIAAVRPGFVRIFKAPAPSAKDVNDVRKQFLHKARRIAQRLEEPNKFVTQRNVRIRDALVRATGVELPADPAAWWQWWRDYNHFESPEQRAVRRKTHTLHCSYYFERLLPPGPSLGSCFPAGTLVWTERGKQPIEEVRAGDRVLSQDSATGELTFQTVRGATVRKPTPNVRVWCGDDKITATLGHPVWVVGEGWRMARFLRPGQLLHTLGGAAPIRQIEEDELQQAYNLIVDGFHTYFVGEQGVLVHDNLLREPTTAVVPGLVD